MKSIKIIKKINIKKATGPDKITNTMLKLGGKPLIKMLKYLLKKFWESDRYRSDWPHGIIVLMPKNNEKITDITNLRPIALLFNISKIFEKMVLNRLRMTKMKNFYNSEPQSGFKKTTDWNLSILARKIHESRSENKK